MKKIALIGSGISTAATIFYLRKTLGERVSFNVFEKSDRVGGRMRNETFAGGFVETGGTIYHTSNLYIQEIMDAYGLKPVVPHGGDGEGNQMGIWDGSKFRLRLPQNDTLASLKIFLRYNFSLLTLRGLVKEAVEKWSKLYEMQAAGLAFSHPKDFYERLDLYQLTQTDAYSFFQHNGVGSKVVEEFVDCVSRVNYAQNGRLNALADLISLAGAGLDGGKLYSVKGGNDQLAQKVLGEPDVTLHLEHEIVAIERPDENAGYLLTGSDGSTVEFDIVVIGCPLDLTPLSVPFEVKRDRPYQELHATFVAGTVNSKFFGLSGMVPNSIVTTENDISPFLSLSKVSWSAEFDRPIYKLFSRKPLDDQTLYALFRDKPAVFRQPWRAYTQLMPMAEWPPFEIGPNLYYPSAMESSFSSIEGQAVAARNVANLILERWKG